MDIGGWLRSLGLERYEAAFRANAIEADVLHDLTDRLGEARNCQLWTRVVLKRCLTHPALTQRRPLVSYRDWRLW